MTVNCAQQSKHRTYERQVLPTDHESHVRRI